MQIKYNLSDSQYIECEYCHCIKLVKDFSSRYRYIEWNHKALRLCRQCFKAINKHNKCAIEYNAKLRAPKLK